MFTSDANNYSPIISENQVESKNLDNLNSLYNYLSISKSFNHLGNIDSFFNFPNLIKKISRPINQDIRFQLCSDGEWCGSTLEINQAFSQSLVEAIDKTFDCHAIIYSSKENQTTVLFPYSFGISQENHQSIQIEINNQAKQAGLPINENLEDHYNIIPAAKCQGDYTAKDMMNPKLKTIVPRNSSKNDEEYYDNPNPLDNNDVSAELSTTPNKPPQEGFKEFIGELFGYVPDEIIPDGNFHTDKDFYYFLKKDCSYGCFGTLRENTYFSWFNPNCEFTEQEREKIQKSIKQAIDIFAKALNPPSEPSNFDTSAATNKNPVTITNQQLKPITDDLSNSTPIENLTSKDIRRTKRIVAYQGVNDKTSNKYLTLEEIERLVVEPLVGDKLQILQFIGSDYPSRSRQEQLAHGNFHIAFLDFDYSVTSLESLSETIKTEFGDIYHLIYTTSSSTPNDLRVRLILALSTPLSGINFESFIKVIGKRLQKHSLTIDSSYAKNCSQLSAAPRQTENYQHLINRSNQFLNPEDFREDIETIKENERIAREAIKQSQKERLEKIKLGSSNDSVIDYINTHYDIEDQLNILGYVRFKTGKDIRYGRPNSDNPGMVLLSNNKVKSYHESHQDIGYNGIISPFDLIAYNQFGNNKTLAVKELAKDIIIASGETLDVVNKSTYAHNQKQHQKILDGQKESIQDDDNNHESFNQTNDNPFPLASDRPSFVLLDNWIEINGEKKAPGVYWCTKKTTKEGTTLTDTWCFPPLFVLAQTRDSEEKNFGRRLAFYDTLGNYKEWIMPNELVYESKGEKIKKNLVNLGFGLTFNGSKYLINYIESQYVKKAMYCVNKVGWYKESFVLPDAIYGNDEVMFQQKIFNNPYTINGTLKEWQDNIGRYSNNNLFMQFVIASAVTGIILKPCNAEGGGFHLYGESSQGKTTLLRVASSLCGGKDYIRSWKSTDNGLEGVATSFNDNFLALDETEQADINKLKDVIYMLGNELGKQRANIYGDARNIASFKCQILSTGERPLKTLIESIGKKTNAGQDVRIVDIPIKGKFGIFDDIYNFNSPADFANHLNSVVTKYYGIPQRVFIERLVSSDFNYETELKTSFNELNQHTTAEQGQEQRVLKRIACIYLAGKLLIKFSIVNWDVILFKTGLVTRFNDWKATREGIGNTEKYKIHQAIIDYIETYETSFCHKSTDNDAIKRIGWYDDIEDIDNPNNKAFIRVYYFTNSGLKTVLKDFNFNIALNYLKESGALMTAYGRNTFSVRINNQPKQCYTIKINKLISSDE